MILPQRSSQANAHATMICVNVERVTAGLPYSDVTQACYWTQGVLSFDAGCTREDEVLQKCQACRDG